jgi:hypothetical protein
MAVDLTLGVAAAAVTALAPALRHLLKRGVDSAAEAAGSELGGDAWNEAKKLWAKLGPEITEDPSAQTTAQKLAADPDDEDLKAALRVHVREILAADNGLRDAVSQNIGSNIQITRSTTQQGEGNIYIEHGAVTQRYESPPAGSQEKTLPKSPVARALLLLGGVLFLTGFGIFLFMLIMLMTGGADTDSDVPPIGIPVAFGVFFVGFVLIVVGNLYDQLTREHDQ